MGCRNFSNFRVQAAFQPAPYISGAPFDERPSEAVDGLHLKDGICFDATRDLVCGSIGIGDHCDLAAVFSKGRQCRCVQALQCLLE